MKDRIIIGKETFILTENNSGVYEIREAKNGSIHEICRFGELNETIYRMIDRMCPAMV